jgi:predicted nucleotidyltransferase
MIEKQMALDNLIYKIRIGSTMYGTTIGISDEDLGGIFIPNKDYIMGIKRCDQVELSDKISKTIRNQKGDTDYVVYSLLKFIKLAIENNPNIIEFFYVPEKCILLKTNEAEELIVNRSLFLSKKAYHTFKGYAYAQRRKLEVKKENMTGRTELAEKFGYDVKFASHLIRLLLECLELLTEKNLTFPLYQNNFIRDIKLGKYKLDFILSEAIRLENLIDQTYIKSDLQYNANFEEINKLQIKLLEDYWKGD